MTEEEIVRFVLKAAAEKSKILHQSGYGTYDHIGTTVFQTKDKYRTNTYGHGDCGYDIITVDKNSILSLEEEIIKELKNK